MVSRRLRPWMVSGNICADTMSGAIADKCRVSADTRFRIATWERKAALVRKRLMRSTLESAIADREMRQAEKRRSEADDAAAAPIVPPPPSFPVPPLPIPSAAAVA
eukprot:7105663-Pyramimonas_sp.AAC.1